MDENKKTYTIEAKLYYEVWLEANIEAESEYKAQEQARELLASCPIRYVVTEGDAERVPCYVDHISVREAK